MKNRRTILFAVLAVMIVAVMIIAAGCNSSAGNTGNAGNAENAGNAGNTGNAGNAGNAENIPENNAAAEDDAGLPDPEAGAVETAESAQPSSEETEIIKEAEAGSESSEDSEASETVEPDKMDQVAVEEESDSISEYFTNEQLEHIRQALGIPDDLPVEVEVSSPYYWEGGGMDLVQVDFYHDGEYAAGAACKPYTEEIARNIYQYFE